MKRLLITGGQGDLAKVISGYFAEHGFEVFAPGHDELEVTDSAAVDAYVSAHGPFTHVIANAGCHIDRNILKLSESDWDSVIGTNFYGAKITAQVAHKYRSPEQPLHIIYIGSYAAIHPQVGQWNYATAKGYLIDLMKEQALRWGRSDQDGGAPIQVNLVLPGFMRTKMTANLPEKVLRNALDKHALKAFNTPENVAKFLHFLSTEMPMTSGQVFNLDSRLVE